MKSILHSFFGVNLCSLWIILGGGWFGLASEVQAQVDYRVLHSFAEPEPTGKACQAPLVVDTNGTLFGVTQEAVGHTNGTVFRVEPDGSGYRVIHSFDYTQGSQPLGGLALGSNGVLYGTTTFGGTHGQGILFRLGRDGSGFAVLKNFGENPSDGRQPIMALLIGTDGRLYGSTSEGGGLARGTVFALNVETREFQILRHMGNGDTDGKQPSSPLIQDADGFLYGTTAEGGLGTQNRNGTLFRLRPDGSDYDVVFRFGSMNSAPNDPRLPVGAIWLSPQGILFGTTFWGGYGAVGTLYRINRDGSGFRILRSIFVGLDQGDNWQDDGSSPWSGVIGDGNGWIYGTTLFGDVLFGNPAGRVFRIREDGTGFTVTKGFGESATDGKTPRAALVRGRDGAFYGSTVDGGREDAGILYKVAFTGGIDSYSKLLDVNPERQPDGVQPAVPLTALADGTIVGVTPKGGQTGNGVLFRLSADGATYSVSHHFGSVIDGRNPSGALLDGRDQFLYGVCESGEGVNRDGILYKAKPDGGNYIVLHSFSTSDGTKPRGRLLLTSEGQLAGVASQGGSLGLGTVWSKNRNGSSFAVWHHFAGGSGDGSEPVGGLIQATNGRFYGMTLRGGTANRGTIYSFATNDFRITVLHSFGSATDPSVTPSAELLIGPDNQLYGVTSGDNSAERGSIFRLGLDGSGFAIVRSFRVAGDGFDVVGPLILGGDGLLYGAAKGGGRNVSGTLFRMGRDGGNFSVLHHFGEIQHDGQIPLAGPILGGDFRLYGVTSRGGSQSEGTVYRLSVVCTISTRIPPPNQTNTYGIPYRFTFSPDTFQYECGTTQLVYSATGLPPGVNLLSDSRTFTGVPSAVGSYSVKLIAADQQNPAVRAEASFVMTVQQTEPVDLLQSSPASLQVNLLPADAAARWKIDWESVWHRSGETASIPLVGTTNLTNAIIEILAPPNLSVPANPPVVLSAGLTQAVDRALVSTPARGTEGLLVELRRNDVPFNEPGEVLNAGWRLDFAGAYQESGSMLPAVPEGPHLIDFRPVAGWITPEVQEVQIVKGQIASVTALYAPPRGSCPNPPLIALDLDTVFASSDPPYRLNGQLSSKAGFGSGVAVGKRVVLTAAHLLFDPVTRAPVPGIVWRQARIAPQREPRPLPALGWFVPEAYSQSLTNGASADAEKSDVAALLFGEDVADGSSGGYLVSLINPSEWLVSTRKKRLVGYPVERGSDCVISPGVMYDTPDRPYVFVADAHPVYTSAGFRGLPGNSGGPIYAQAPNNSYYPAGVYLGDGRNGTVSRVRAIDQEVVDLILRATAAARGDTNFTGGGVVPPPTYVPASAVRGLQRLRVQFSPPAAITAGAAWKRSSESNAAYRTVDAQFSPGPYELSFRPVPGFSAPTNTTVQIFSGQDTILMANYAETNALRLFVTLATGIRVEGPAGTKVQLQHRARLGSGSWVNVEGRLITLSGSPVTLFEPARLAQNPGFYQVVVP